MKLEKPEDLYKEENLGLCILACKLLEWHEEWKTVDATPSGFTLECDSLRVTISTTLTE